MPDPNAVYRQNPGQQDYTPGSAASAGDLIQLSDGRAAVVKADLAASEQGAVYTAGIVDVDAATGTLFSAGDPVWFDASTEKAVTTNTDDFLVGTAVAAKVSGDLSVRVDLNASAASAGGLDTDMYVHPSGSDTYGNGSRNMPFASITAAFAAVTATRKTIHVAPGTYTEAAAMSWPAFSGVKLLGAAEKWATVIGVASAEDQICSFVSGVLSSTFEMTINNIQFDHDEAGMDGLVINNTGATKKINLYLQNVGFEADSSSDSAILVTHGDLNNAVRIYAEGENGDVSGAITYSAHNDGDRLYFTRMNMTGGIVCGATAVAANVQLIECEILHEGITGGSTSTVVQLVNCYTNASGTYALADTNDVAGSITGENIVGS